jgi:DNA helicase-2/ATP-dependent DNA helicase PcrA
MQDRQAHYPVSRPREAAGLTIDLTADSAYSIGDRVFHVKFGYGRVTGIEGDKLDIRFDKAGEKKIIARFVMSADPGDEVPF